MEEEREREEKQKLKEYRKTLVIKVGYGISCGHHPVGGGGEVLTPKEYVNTFMIKVNCGHHLVCVCVWGGGGGGLRSAVI